MTARFAIAGSGPAGCYLADALARAAPGAAIDVFERLDEPFGLVRFGVAPDHEQTRAIARVLRRPFDKGAARLHLGVEVGRDIALEALRRDYDAVALATGAPVDRRLGAPGEELAEPSGRFIRWINGHPEAAPPARLAGARRAVVIGAGNVALDAVRLLAKHREIGCLNPLALERIDLLIRGGPEDVRFTPAELVEIGELAAAWPVDDQGDSRLERVYVDKDFFGHAHRANLRVRRPRSAILRPLPRPMIPPIRIGSLRCPAGATASTGPGRVARSRPRRGRVARRGTAGGRRAGRPRPW